jgi:hypothetical protein
MRHPAERAFQNGVYDLTEETSGAHHGGSKNVRQYLAAVAVAVLATMSACSSGSDSPPPDPGPQPWLDDTRQADSVGHLGGSDTPCHLPVTFDLAKSWKAKAVDAEGGAGLTHQGGFTMACEVDAKPAGHLGFLRVWTAPKSVDTARQALDKFLAADRGITVPETREVGVASVSGAEVTYIRDSPAADSKKRERLLAVATPSGTAILALGGFDTGEHEAMLPAYMLAKKTLRFTNGVD